MIMRSCSFTFFKVSTVIAFSISVFGCQLTATTAQDIMTTPGASTSLGDYYLWLKTLKENELTKELKAQKMEKTKGSKQAKYRLLLLQSVQNLSNQPVSKTPIVNTKVPQQELKLFSANDLAVITILKDQLDQQLQMTEQLAMKEKVNIETKNQLSAQQKNIQKLELRIQKLQQQIIQLKEIERSINSHGTLL
jgi:hypothetical protein